MAVRVKLLIESKKGKVETSALVNSGFESKTPLIILPFKVAEKLGFHVGDLKGEQYLGAGGTPVIVYPLPEKLVISVLTKDRKQGPIFSRASVSLGEREVMLSDAASSAFKISIDDLKKGIWRFSDESKGRRSVKKEEWF